MIHYIQSDICDLYGLKLMKTLISLGYLRKLEYYMFQLKTTFVHIEMLGT